MAAETLLPYPAFHKFVEKIQVKNLDEKLTLGKKLQAGSFL